MRGTFAAVAESPAGPFVPRDARGKLYELEIEGSGLRIGRQLTELDGGG